MKTVLAALVSVGLVCAPYTFFPDNPTWWKLTTGETAYLAGDPCAGQPTSATCPDRTFGWQLSVIDPKTGKRVQDGTLPETGGDGGSAGSGGAAGAGGSAGSGGASGGGPGK